MIRLEKQSREDSRRAVQKDTTVDWKCGLCDSQNSGELTTCDICHTDRKKTWDCPQCTCTNELSAQVCKACQRGIDEQSLEFRTGTVKREEKSEDYRTNWDCQYEFCKQKNGPSESYCTRCGVAKLNSGECYTPVFCFQNRNLIRVWVCGKCTTRNKIEANKSGKWKCEICLIFAEDKPSVPDTPNNYSATNDLAIDVPNKWECSRCQFMNELQLLTCKVCYEAKKNTWNCHKCTKNNEISNRNCDACGEKKPDPTVTGQCVNCRQQRNINQEGLCGKCWDTRGTDWTCGYSKCRNRNYGNREYCCECGLKQFDPTIKGQIIKRNSNHHLVQVWICSNCNEINDVLNEDCCKCRYQRY